MTRVRVAAAAAALLTALLLQATLIEPLRGTLVVSLPAVLVACVALVDGPGAGMSFGFAAGLIADLASRHPAGILALTWMGLGLVAGRLAAERPARSDGVIAGVLCGLAGVVAGCLLAVVRADGASVSGAFTHLVPAVLADAVLAWMVAFVVRRFLRAQAMRPTAALSSEVVLGFGHG